MAEAKFDASWWDVWEMRRQANKIAEEEGVEEKGPFRHAYTSAKTADRYDNQDDIWFEEGKSAVKAVLKNIFTPNAGVDLNNGKTISRGMGIGNEIVGKDFVEDTQANEIGLLIRDEVDRDVLRMKEEWQLTEEQAQEWRERLLRTRIAEAMKEGKSFK